MRPLVPAALATVVLTAAAGGARGVTIQLRDSRTGLAVAGTIAINNPAEARFSTGLSSRISLDRMAGELSIAARASGYRPLTTRLTTSEPLQTTLWLDPVFLPPELDPASVAERSRPGMLLIHGHVIDETTTMPVEEADIRMANSGVTARTDARGYFSLLTPAGGTEAEHLTSDDVIVEKDGYGRYELRKLLLHEGDVHIVIDLVRGGALTVRDASHKLAPLPSAAAEDRLPRPQAEAFGGLADAPLSFAVPDTLRVGFDCSSARTCTRVSVYSLETYVANGLDDEWIASWPAESLKAGAVAYRSYGAWHVLHPRTSTYDICSTTSCQVNKPETTTSSAIAAAAATRGVLAVNATRTEPFFAEYSAHNNNKCPTTTCTGGGYTWTSCGDGYCGRPPEWPCLADPVETGYTLAGHGGGMSQWGSYRWNLQGRDWRWIVDHYYNDNGHPAGSRSAPMNAAITVLARNGPDEWQGAVEFTLGSTTGTLVPFTMSGAPGTFTLAWREGGPAGSTFTRVAPSPELEVASGDSATLTLEFAPQCTTFTASQSSVSAGAGAGSTPIAISGSPDGCNGGAWSATAQASWLTISPSSGSGPATATLAWSANSSYARSATVAIGGQTILVTQSGATIAAPQRAVKRK